MIYKVKTRDGEVCLEKESVGVKILYGNVFGRFFARIFSFSVFSKIAGCFLDSRFSKFMINKFVVKKNIDISLYEDKEYRSFNDFFVRKKKSEFMEISKESNAFIAPCDGRVVCYDINNDSVFKIKNSFFSVKDLLNGDARYKDFLGGYALVFRLAPSDYHRYIYIDNGKKERNNFIKGVLHTVRPIVLEKFNIYKMNSREYTFMETENFGCVCQVEVGAVLVGKISNYHNEYSFKKGEEKGMFQFGGSTIVFLVKKGVVKIDDDILNNSKEGVETFVKCGSKIGVKNEL